MLQVPCLSPPIYGHSHYKKFWLRQTEIGGSSSGSSCVEVMNSNDSSQKKICGKRRQNLRCPSSPIKVSLNESSVCASPSSSEELLNHSPLSAVENREDDHEFDEQKIVREEEEEAAVLDCLKCNSDSRPDSFSDSDSATSSTSQATDHEGEDQKSSPLRQFLKRKAKAEGLVLNSPKTRSSQGTITDIHLPVSPGNASRTCKHCGTMKTPLWRNGPLGPKSLCNACGIRLRKARRNNQEAGSNGQATVLSTKRKMSPQVEGTAVVTYKKSKVGLKMSILQQTQEDIPKKVLGRSLSKDEEEGAVLLMALSYGLVLA